VKRCTGALLGYALCLAHTAITLQCIVAILLSGRMHWMFNQCLETARIYIYVAAQSSMVREGIPEQVLPEDEKLSKWTLSTHQFGRDWEFSWISENMTPIRLQKIHWRSMQVCPVHDKSAHLLIMHNYGCMILRMLRVRNNHAMGLCPLKPDMRCACDHEKLLTSQLWRCVSTLHICIANTGCYR